jgi:ArsR family transcriptional regulator
MDMTAPTPAFYELHSEFCKCLSHPVRIQILETLAGGEKSFAELLAVTGQSKVNLSRHLTVLTNRGVVRRRRQGKHIRLSIANPKIVQACHLMRQALVEIMTGDMTTITAGPVEPDAAAPSNTKS